MKPKDPDTFIDIGVSITRLLLIASGQGMAASLIGEGAGLVKNLRNLLGSGGQRAVSAEKIADYVFNEPFSPGFVSGIVPEGDDDEGGGHDRGDGGGARGRLVAGP